MRNGSYIRALGRMSFEPSPTQPDQASSSQETGLGDASNPDAPGGVEDSQSPGAEHGSPAAQSAQTSIQNAARELQSNLIRAQNDVLATVGVCLAESHQRPNEEIMNQVIRENVVGTYVRILEMIAGYLAGWPLIGIRNRAQTFRTFEHVRFIDILRQTYPKHSILDPFIGMPAHLCFQASRVAMDYLGTRFLMWLMNTELCLDPETGKLRRHSVLAIQILDNGFQLLSWCIFFPLYEYSTLQTLHLTTPLPLLPPLSAFRLLHFGSSSIGTATGVFPSWIPSSILRVVDSYVLLSFVQSKLYVYINEWLAPILSRSLLPRPVNPDQASRLVDEAESRADNEEESPRERRRRRRSVQSRSTGQGNNDGVIPGPDESTRATIAATEQQSDELAEWDGEWLQDDGEPSSSGGQAGNENAQTDTSGVRNTEDSPNQPPEEQDDSVEDFVLEDLQFLPIGTHVPDTPDPAIPIHPPRSSSFTPHQSRRHQHHHNHDSDQSHDPRTTTPSHLNSRPLHRVTNLSCYPCDAAAGHIAEALATGVTLGLESAVLRSIARQYLGRQPSSMARGFSISNVYTTRELFYPRKNLPQWGGVVKALAIEYVTTWGLWEFTYWASTWLGLSMFGYHS